jgi:hypothetical protein
MVLSMVWVAVVLGLLVGVGMAMPVFLSARLLRTKTPGSAVFGAMGSMFGGMILGLILMLVYWFVAPAGFTSFAFALVGGFAVCAGVGGVKAAHSAHHSQEMEK